MYKKHQAFVQAFGAKSPENMAKVLRFVVLTIQNRFINVQSDLEIVDSALFGAADYDQAQGILYGHKQSAIDFIESDKERLFHCARLVSDSDLSAREKAESLLTLFCDIPGLGLVKA